MPALPGPRTRASLLFLAACAALIVLGRLLTFHEPLHGDLAFYAVSAREWLSGRALYSDLFDVKPPGVFWAYALAQSLFGHASLSVFMLNAGCAVLTMLAAFFAGSFMGGRASTGLWAAAFWALISGDASLWANQPNAEAFINLFSLAGLALFLRGSDGEDMSAARAAAAGVLFALAALFKQNALPVFFFLLAAHAARARAPGRRPPLKGVLIACGAALACGALPLAGALAAGQGEALKDLLLCQSNYVASSGGALSNLLRSLGPAALPGGDWRPVAHLLLLFLFGFTGLAHGLYRGKGGAPLLLLGYMLGVQAAVALPGWSYTQYYQLWLPFLAAAGAWTVESLGLSGLKNARRSAAAAGAVTAAALLAAQLPALRLSAEELSVKKHGPEFALTARAGRDLKALLLPGESFYAWGSQPGLYFYSGLRPATGLFYNPHLVAGPLRGKLSRRLLDELSRDPPELFIALEWELETARKGGPAHPVLAWGLENYREFAWDGHRGAFAFFARKGGALEKRIRSGSLPARFPKIRK